MQSASCPTLTKTQAAYVEIASDPEVMTAGEVARRRGVTIQSAHAMLMLPEVKAELARRETERLDKARGFSYILDQLQSRALDQLAHLARDQTLTIQEAGSIAKLVSDMRQTEAKLPQREQQTDPSAASNMRRRAIAWGIRLGRGVKVCGQGRGT